ncbi:hypothetical protein YT1_p20040 (plasmid) [Rhodococcus ruber]|nr:hypothetical protein YT1_p20040 [Rhodococcus ruber]
MFCWCFSGAFLVMLVTRFWGLTCGFAGVSGWLGGGGGAGTSVGRCGLVNRARRPPGKGGFSLARWSAGPVGPWCGDRARYTRSSGNLGREGQGSGGGAPGDR